MKNFEIIAEGKVERVCKELSTRMVFVPIFIFPISDTDNYIYIKGEGYKVDDLIVFPSLKDVKVGDVVKIVYNESKKITFLGTASCENSEIYEAYSENKTLDNFIAIFTLLLLILAGYNYEIFIDGIGSILSFLDMGAIGGFFFIILLLLLCVGGLVTVGALLASITLGLLKRFKKKKVGI